MEVEIKALRSFFNFFFLFFFSEINKCTPMVIPDFRVVSETACDSLHDVRG